MNQPVQTRMRRLSLRHALMVSTALLVLPEATLAQEVSCPVDSVNCTVPAGNFNTPYAGQSFNGTPVTFVNNGTFNVTTPQTATFLGALQSIANGQSGASSSSGNAGSGTDGPTISFTNAGMVTHSISSLINATNVANTVYAASIGGNGGTDSNAQANAGNAGAGSAATLANSATITVNQAGASVGTPSTLLSGAALLVDSVGGNGGNVTSQGPDSNQNPTYHTANGAPGAAAGSATLTNSGTVSVSLGQPLVSIGYWGAGARSLGGAAGTGNDGQPGGNGGTATVINTGNVGVAFTWNSTQLSASNSLTPTQGGFAVVASSQGGAGVMSVNSGNNGGSGGNASNASVLVDGTARPANLPVTITLNTGYTPGSGVPPIAAAVAALSRGGSGGSGYDSSTGGFGGATGSAQVALLGAVQVQASGNSTYGVLAAAQGGVGGSTGVAQDNSKAGDGGSTGTANSGVNAATVTIVGATVATTGFTSHAVAAISQGGPGGVGLDYKQTGGLVQNGGVGGNGGNNGAIRMDIAATTITTTGEDSIGVLAITQGGWGGNGGNLTSGEGNSGPGGAGGQSAPIVVNINAGTTITTGADGSHGVSASSLGGGGGTGGAVNVLLGAGLGNGGAGGGGYDVTVTLAPGTGVMVNGLQAIGVLARSVGGPGGAGALYNSQGGISSNAANGGPGGNSGTVLITSGATIFTRGNAGHGLVAQSVTGTGGTGGTGAGVVYAPAGSGGSSGFTGSATINNSGFIQTVGAGANAIQAQSIGGDSGSGGSSSGGLVTLGGSGSAAANGNFANVTHTGSITTFGQNSLGILAQSIGGGGGNGGDSSAGLSAVGGTGSGGGAGDTVTVNVNGSITTLGQLAHGVVAQSIGGGGGNGGNASDTGAFVALAIGGSGAAGGTGGAVVLNATGGTINTYGSNAIGMVAQSIGGGGGTGGGAYALAGGLGFSAGVSIGGNGGAGGSSTNANGPAVQATLNAITISTGLSTRAGTNTNPVDAHGLVLQSIGGGGGAGGSASAAALTAAIPIPDTDTSYSAALTYAMGGKGGTGGAGGYVFLTLGGASSITTQGQGSHGVLLQSIGGGGGAGGDSSAMATTLSLASATDRENFSLSTSVAVGGGGGTGATGGPITANINGGVITTYGDFANALVAQSIGGGGGNGGVGSTTTQSFGSTASLGLGIGVGGTGGTGGNSSVVQVNLAAGATLQTYGAGSVGLMAQSIGGGGGTSQGSTVNLGGAVDGDGNVTRAAQISVSVGGTGGAGGDGGLVVANMAGTIATSGGDSAGVVLQSIGGGGGVGGTAGADASADNPVSPVAKARQAVTNAITGSSTQGYSASVAVGGNGGAAGQGGAINYSQFGRITTQGDWSRGVVLQSIGGGGGMGGIATSNSSGSSFAASLAVGGGGGAAGAGGAITIQMAPGSVISTGVAGISGYGAFGLLAQSIGGGGGTGVDGSAQSQSDLALGAGVGGNGGAAGNAGYVSFSGTTTIVTAGAVAAGLVLQSIGGGGGLAARGSTLSASYGDTNLKTTLQVGGQSGSSGDSGGIGINASLTIQTAGAHAYGILAQGIGGGGGFAFTENGTTVQFANVGGTEGGGSGSGSGGGISMTLAGGGIQTSGFAAHGIVAQSIGGGGGIAGLPASNAVTMSTTNYAELEPQTVVPSGAGGSVNITSSTPITTRGDLAYGILAQSIGGSGGLVVNSNQLYAGVTFMPLYGQTGSSRAEAVNIIQSAPIVTSGLNSVGIFAQSRGSGGDGSVSVGIQSTVQGGSGPQGVGVWVDSSNTANIVSITTTGSLSALSGNALLMTAGQAVNNGTVTGNVTIGNNGTFTNNGQYNPGTTANVGLLVNTGRIAIASHTAFGVTAVSGAFTQTSTGRLIPDADFAGGRSDVMTVAGAASLDGRVRPRISSVLPNVELPFLVVGGPVTGQITGDQTEIFGYDVSRKGGTFSVSANADFTPAGYNLSRDGSFVANYMQAAWDVGGQGLGRLFATLGNLADTGGQAAYSAALRQISPNSAFAPGARLAAGARAFANAAMSCPQFDGTTSMLVEGECIWGGLTGRTAAQAGTDGISSFRLNSTTWQVGGQRNMGGGWFLGGSIAYENSRLSTTDGLNSGRGQAGFGAITGKYQTGPWLFSGAVFGGGGEFNSTRTITLPGFGSIARGSPTLAQVGGALRATYTIGREEFYLRPSMTLSLVHARSGAYRESGAGLLNLDVAAASNTVAGLTPALELGGRVNLQDGTVLRLFTSAGVSLLSSGDWTQQSRLVGAPAAAGRFSSQVQTDQVVGRVVAGVQVYATNRLELRLQYEGEYSANLTGHGGSFALAYRF
ncbi:autotransporter outer membrane beta-barrel domain-containing protein [Sediminicoccus rosea]|uniref:Autotransporter outer membrane beta-barrel domain-containing protein n=1 Tax=Sediminicoccus rosea TaxID=1225128 RepID=A0ABZ0PBK6_9PROT|nr:autotransporter outer membrane beta-barrel domain-containing protein [Sediminicoccus rosea]WPB82901.1 autotransporter outer membrane beta-barrel domain-containing protein [Sediminicoccus rosea]